MKKSLLTALLLCLASVPAPAATFDLDFNDSSVQLGFAHNLSEDEYGSARGRLRFLYNDPEETTLGSAGLDFAGSPGNVPGLELGIGAQLVGGEADRSQDLFALAVGVQANWAPPTLGGLGFGGRVSYAPEIFCWLDSERLVESAVRLSYAVTPRASLFLEYQNIRSDFEEHGTWTIDDDVRGGFEARF